MKKKLAIIVILVVAFFTACGSGSGVNNKKTRTAEDLMDAYTQGYVEVDIDKALKVFPEFYKEFNKANLTKEKLQDAVNHAKEEYGDDFHITYEITSKTKLTAEELKTFNEQVKRYYETNEEASECYALEGTITFTGSKFTDPDPLTSIDYCNYSDGWYLIGR